MDLALFAVYTMLSLVFIAQTARWTYLEEEAMLVDFEL